MTKFIVPFLIFLSSCSVFNNLKNRVVGFNSGNIIRVGQNEQEVYKNFGSPELKARIAARDFVFYKSGFIVIENGLISAIESYDVTYKPEFSFSSHIPEGTNLISAIKSLGYPQEFKESNTRYYFRYVNGAFIANNEKVLKVVDKLYKDDIAFIVTLSSFSDSSAKREGKYFIAPGSASINPKDFLFKELKNYLSLALKDKGMNVTSDMTKADYILLVNFGISDPKESIDIVSRSVFVPHYSPGQTTNVYGAYGNQIGSVKTQGQWSSQYAGQQTETIRTVTFNRWLNVEAIDYKIWIKNNEQHPVWKILTNSEGSSGDIRLVLPALTLGIQNYINKDSGTQLRLSAFPEVLNSYVFESKLLNE